MEYRFLRFGLRDILSVNSSVRNRNGVSEFVGDLRVNQATLLQKGQQTTN